MEDNLYLNKEHIHFNHTYAVCYDANRTQFTALSSEQVGAPPGTNVSSTEFIAASTASGLQYTAIFMQVIQMI